MSLWQYIGLALAAIFLIAAYLMGRNDTPTDIDDICAAADNEIRNRARLG